MPPLKQTFFIAPQLPDPPPPLLLDVSVPDEVLLESPLLVEDVSVLDASCPLSSAPVEDVSVLDASFPLSLPPVEDVSPGPEDGMLEGTGSSVFDVSLSESSLLVAEV